MQLSEIIARDCVCPSPSPSPSVSSQLAQPHCSVPATALDPRLFLTLSSLQSLSSLPYLPFPFFLSLMLPCPLWSFSFLSPSPFFFHFLLSFWSFTEVSPEAVLPF